MLKKIILLLGSIMILFFFNIIGLFDVSEINIDDFSIKKPFLYRNLTKENKIDLNHTKRVSISFLHSFNKSGILYSFTKLSDKVKFLLEVKYLSEKEIFDISGCFIEEKENIFNSGDDSIVIQTTYVYSYPYIVSFNEITNERKEKIIKQLCKNKKIREKI